MPNTQVRNMVRVELDGQGEWVEADVVMGGKSIHVTRRFGSWMHDTGAGYREVVPELAFTLQRKARSRWPKIEKKLQEVR